MRPTSVTSRRSQAPRDAAQTTWHNKSKTGLETRPHQNSRLPASRFRAGGTRLSIIAAQNGVPLMRSTTTSRWLTTTLVLLSAVVLVAFDGSDQAEAHCSGNVCWTGWYLVYDKGCTTEAQMHYVYNPGNIEVDRHYVRATDTSTDNRTWGARWVGYYNQYSLTKQYEIPGSGNYQGRHSNSGYCVWEYETRDRKYASYEPSVLTEVAYWCPSLGPDPYGTAPPCTDYAQEVRIAITGQDRWHVVAREGTALGAGGIGLPRL